LIGVTLGYRTEQSHSLADYGQQRIARSTESEPRRTTMGPKHVLGACEAFLFYNKPIKYSSYRAGAGEGEENSSNIQVCKNVIISGAKAMVQGLP